MSESSMHNNNMQTHIPTVPLFYSAHSYCREGNTATRFITTHQILQSYSSAVYYTHISVAGMHSLFLTDDIEENMHNMSPFVHCHCLIDEKRIPNAITITNLLLFFNDKDMR